jgi:hypothetical protein
MSYKTNSWARPRENQTYHTYCIIELFEYSLLYHYLHSYIETGCPVASMSRVLSRNIKVTSQSDTVLSRFVLRKGWNAFARLLDINYETCFTCKKCGPEPQTVVCDATDLGIKQDLLPEIKRSVHLNQPVQASGTKHTDRVYIHSTSARDLLKRLSKSKEPLSKREFAKLISLLKTDGCGYLVQILQDIKHYRGNKVYIDQAYSILLSELSKNTPICGIYADCRR